MNAREGFTIKFEIKNLLFITFDRICIVIIGELGLKGQKGESGPKGEKGNPG